jgi:Ni,Fe-hydrogenase I large subunit
MLSALPMPSLMLSQQGLDPRLSVMLAQANYSSLSQQYDNMQAVRYLQQQMSFGSLSSALVSGSFLGQSLSKPSFQYHSEFIRQLLSQPDW